MGSALRRWHGPSRRGAIPGVVDFRSTVVSRGFSAPAVVSMDLLSGFERPSLRRLAL
jgi:hypothetical protein